MMGQRGGSQDRLFYSFNLDDHVPRNHLLRGIDRFFDLGELRHHLAPFYSHTGRPSIDPELMIRMLIVGYCFGIRSERRLCEEVHLNLAYRWFCRLDLEAAVPDHSTFSKNRHGRFRESDAFRHVFESVLRRCMSEGLVGGEGFAIDASVIKADANRARGVPGTEVIDWSKGGRSEPRGARVSRALEESNPTSDDAGEPPEPPTAPQERLADRSGGTLDRCAGRAGVLRLLDQLPDRSGGRDHRGRRGHARAPNAGGRVDQDDDRPRRAALRSQA